MDDIKSLMMINQDINDTLTSEISEPLDALEISDTISDLDYYEEIRLDNERVILIIHVLCTCTSHIHVHVHIYIYMYM